MLIRQKSLLTVRTADGTPIIKLYLNNWDKLPSSIGG